MYAAICARCNAYSDPTNTTAAKPKDWRVLALSTYTYPTHDNVKVLHFCPACSSELNIPDEVKRQTTTEEELVGLIETLIAEQVEIQVSNL